MDESTRLIAEILADPASEAARLVYADHLIERGDPRGELIQLECSYERLDPDDPDRLALATRIDDLIAVHETAWTRELRALGLGDHVQQLAFRRGFVEMVSLDVELAKKLPLIRSLTPVREVHLTTRDRDPLDAVAELLVDVERFGMFGLGDSGRAAAKAFARWPHRGKLRALKLPGGSESANAVVRARGLDGLVELNLFGVREGAVELLRAPHLASLERLELPQIALTPEAITELARGALTRLTALELEHTGLDAAKLATLANGPLLGRLRHLRLNSNRIGDAGARTLVDHARQLEVLDLDGAGIGDVGAASVLGAKSLTALRRLDLSRCHLTGTGFAEAVRRFALPELRQLVAIENELDFHALRALGSAPLERLHVLDLSSNPLGNEAITALAQTSGLPALHTLQLQRTRCGERALAALGASDLGARLRRLDLTGNQIDDDGVLELLAADRLDALVRLELGGTRLTRRGVQALATSPLARRLEYLDVAVATSDDLAPLLHAELPELRMLVANAFDDAAASWLGKAGKLPKLHTLVFSAPDLTDDGARTLAQTPLDRVLWMELDAPKLGAAGKTAIRERFAHHAYVFSGALLHAFRSLGRRI
ncbi:MAG TPA: TIGR02996 domain-containing protein [Kofleriaceae bacterium]|nr:TIGR02996 domain-containing protein [Kofleriaceae bacterium]